MNSGTRSWVGMTGLVIALAVGAGAFFYLRDVKESVEELAKDATTPPPPELNLSAPQLFPAETSLFLAVHGIDKSWDVFEAWQKRFEPTAIAYLINMALQDPSVLPPDIRGGLDMFDHSLNEMEARFGYRPTTRDFFQTYGKYTAVGVLPGETPEKMPRFLAVIRLPGKAASDLFETRLSEHSSVQLSDPPSAHGFPLFEEERAGMGKLYYGIGRSFLFLGPESGPVVKALGRLRKLLDGEKVAETLADDPIFQRGVPDPWEKVRFAFHVQRKAPFGDWMEDLRQLDDYIESGFVLAGDDPAIAFSSVETDEGWKMRSSFPFDRSKEWIDLIPAGAERVILTAAPSRKEMREAWGPVFKRFEERAIWKELGALLRDDARLSKLREEALPPGLVPPEVVSRLKHDVDLVAAVWDSMSESAMTSRSMSLGMAGKSYERDGVLVPQGAVGIEVDPLSVYHLAACLEMGRAYGPGFLRFETFEGGMSWSVDMESVMAGMPPEMEAQMASIVDPALILSSGRVFLVFGAEFRDEIVQLLMGKGTSLRADELFSAALDGAPDGWSVLDYMRPAALLRSNLSSSRNLIDKSLSEMAGATESSELDLVRGIFGCVDRFTTFLSQVKAVLTTAYPGRPAYTVTLMDPEVEKSVPALAMSPSALKVIDLLPDTTWFLVSMRIKTAEIVDDLEKAFLEGVGGQERWDAVRGVNGEPPDEVLGRAYDILLRGIEGEAGVAVAVPSGLPPEQMGLTLPDLIARAPEFVVFAEYADAEAAFSVWESILGRLGESLNPTPFDERMAEFQEGLAPPPTGARLSRNSAEGLSHVALEIMVPEGFMGQYMTYTISCIRKGSYLFLTSGLSVFSHLIETDGRTLPTLRAGLTKAFGTDPLPAELANLSVIRSDGMVDNLHLLLEPMVPILSMMSMQGYGMEEPPPDRVEAHMQGWTRAVELIEDLFRTGTTTAGWSVRTGDRIRWNWNTSGPSSGSDPDAKAGK
ncbi:MAG: hypothetical protein O6952_06545 [Planctomycetota bacterium]|nr:hypothetical protein [Planctomycetota bacterium]